MAAAMDRSSLPRLRLASEYSSVTKVAETSTAIAALMSATPQTSLVLRETGLRVDIISPPDWKQAELTEGVESGL